MGVDLNIGLPENIVKILMRRYKPDYVLFETAMSRSMSGLHGGTIYYLISREAYKNINDLSPTSRTWEQASELVIHKVGNTYQVFKDRDDRFTFELKGLEKVLYE